MGIFKNDDKQSSAFGFDENSMAGKAVKAVRWIYAITGVLALVTGIALLFAPAKSLVFLTTVLGFYFVITAAIRLFTAVFEPLLPTGWRVTSIIANLLILLGGVVILRNQAFSTATLTTLVVVVAGFGWIVEGVMSILESELSANRALAILSGLPGHARVDRLRAKGGRRRRYRRQQHTEPGTPHSPRRSARRRACTSGLLGHDARCERGSR